MAAPIQKNTSWNEQYESLLPSLVQFSGRLESLIRDVLTHNQIPFHVIESRAKTSASFLEKISRPGKSYVDPLREITDLVGLRAILYYPSDVDAVATILRSQFSVDERNSIDKRTELAHDQFGYASVHLVCKISDNRCNLPEWAPFGGFSFEIQIRTVLQHAWASISHALQYKHESDVPDQFKRRLNRLSGLLELADAEFMSLKEQRVVASAEAASKVHEKDFSISLNSLSLKEYLYTSETISKISKAAEKAGLRVDSNEEGTQLSTFSSFLKLQTLGELDSLLKKALPLAYEFFSAFEKRYGSDFLSGDRDHWATVLLVAIKRDSVSKDELSSIGFWGTDYIEEVLATASALRVVS